MKRTFIVLFIFFLFAGLQGYSQRSGSAIDMKQYSFNIVLADSDDTLRCDAELQFTMINDADSIQLDLASVNSKGKGMMVNSVTMNDKPLSFTHTGDKLTVRFPSMIYHGQSESIEVKYKGIPADGLIISKSKYGRRTFFGDNWPDRAHNWLVCIDHPADKAAVNFSIAAPQHYQVVANGVKTEEVTLPNSRRLTIYKDSSLLPTKVMVIGLADFAVSLLGNVDCIPVTAWVYTEDRENASDYAQATEILPYFIKNIGPYPYRKLANVQSKTIYGGMENAGNIFYYENSITGHHDLEPLLAHEIAHQWFGNTVTESDWAHIWLSEGFATYMTNVYMESKYGQEALEKRLKDDRQKVIEFSKKHRGPVVDSAEKEYTKLLNPNSYQKGGWVLHMLRRKLGDTMFWNGLRTYYRKYRGRNADTRDFEEVMEKVSGRDLSDFFRQWLYTPGQPRLDISWKYDEIKKTLRVNVEQMQEMIFHFPIQIGITDSRKNFSIKSFDIKERKNIFSIPLSYKPESITADPEINLLFEDISDEK